MQIDYTSRDFESLKADLISLINVRTGYNWDPTDPSDFGSVLVESFSYMGDIMSYYIDRAANETSVETAVKTDTLLRFAELYGYKPSGPTSAEVAVTFTNVSTSNIDLPIGTQVMAPLTYGQYSEIFFETTEAIVQLQPDQSATVNAKEGKTANTDRPDLIDPATNKPLPVNLGTSNGLANQEFTIYDLNIVDNSLVIYVGQGVAFSAWKYVDTLVDAPAQGLVFTTRLNSDGTTTIIFGDGTAGGIPPVNQLVSALYKTSVGISGNIVSNAIEEVTFIPGNGNPEAVTYVTATNNSQATGGADADSISQLRTKIKAAISSKNRAVTLEDYESLALQVSRVGKAKAIADVYTSVTIYLQSQDDGSSTPGIAGGVPTSSWTSMSSAVQSYVQAKSPIGTTVTVQSPEYTPIYVSADVVIGDAYKQSSIKLAIAKAFLNAGGLFDYSSNTFGRTVPKSAVIAAIANIEGVTSVDLTKLNTDGGSSVATISLTSRKIPYLLPDNLVLTVTGGIA